MIPGMVTVPAAATSRLFFGLAVPAEVRAMAGLLQDETRRAMATARFPALEDLHITLAFLGRTDPALIPALVALAAEAAGTGRAFTLRTAGPGGFPHPGRSRILWLGFQPEPALDALAGRLREALRAGRVAFDEKPFRPHLTLARFREPADLGRIPFPPMEPLAFAVREITLFRSVPVPQGTTYQREGKAVLGQ